MKWSRSLHGRVLAFSVKCLLIHQTRNLSWCRTYLSFVKKKSDNDKTLDEHSFTKRALRLRQREKIKTLLWGSSARTGSAGPTTVASCDRLTWGYCYRYLHDVGQPLFFSIRDRAASACGCLGSPTMAI